MDDDAALFSHPGIGERLTALRERGIHSPRNPDVREAVRLRANDACEYCLLPTAGKFNIEHIIPPARWNDYSSGRLPGVTTVSDRRGPNHIDNYAWSCPFCNGAKGKRVSHGAGRRATRFFDPRYDRWSDHFTFPSSSGYIFIVGATEVGRVTAGLMGLDFNAGGPEGPLGLRHKMILLGEYPPTWTRRAYGL